MCPNRARSNGIGLKFQLLQRMRQKVPKSEASLVYRADFIPNDKNKKGEGSNLVVERTTGVQKIQGSAPSLKRRGALLTEK